MRRRWTPGAWMWPVLWVAAGCGGGAPETPPPQEAARAAAPATGAGSEAGRGSIAGRVVLAGPRPQPAPVQVTKDVEVCGVHPIVDESLVVGAGGGIRDVVLSLAGAPSEPLPAAELRQKGCVFIPHVTLVPAGAPLKIYNDDGVLHNLHTFSTLNPAFNKAQPKYMKVMEATFERPETIKVACDAHPWMAAWLVVTEHRFVAVTDAEGAFRIDSVPAGSYAARVWHETLGERAVTVEVRAGQPSDLSLEFSR